MRSAAERHPLVLVWFGVVLFSTGPVIVAGAGLSGVAFAFWRAWFGVAILGAATLLHTRLSESSVSRSGWGWALGCGVAFAAHQLMFLSALRATSVVDVTLMNTVAPIVVGVLAVPAFGERPGTPFRVWSAVAMLGAAAVAVAGSSGPDGNPTGMALAAGGVVWYAVFFVGSKLARPSIATVPFLFGVLLAAALTTSLWVLASGEAVTPLATDDLLRCLAVAALPGAIGHFSVTWALRSVPANLPPVIMLCIPLLSGVMAWVLLGQEVAGGQLLAGAATLVGVAGAVRSPSAHRLAADKALVLAEES